MGDGGDAPPLASKKISPPLQPKSGTLKKLGQERDKIKIFEYIFFFFVVF